MLFFLSGFFYHAFDYVEDIPDFLLQKYVSIASPTGVLSMNRCALFLYLLYVADDFPYKIIYTNYCTFNHDDHISLETTIS